MKNSLLAHKKIIGFSFFMILALGLSAFAEGGEEVHEAAVPRVVFFQALNFFALLVLIYFLVRKKVVAFFAKRHDDLTLALREAKRLKDEAEQKHQEYVLKIQNLEKDAAKILEQIRSEGEASKQRMVAEGKRMAEAIEAEAKRTAQTVVEKASAELYDEVLHQALAGARSLLTKSVVETDQRRLQKEFVEKIEAVQ